MALRVKTTLKVFVQVTIILSVMMEKILVKIVWQSEDDVFIKFKKFNNCFIDTLRLDK